MEQLNPLKKIILTTAILIPLAACQSLNNQDVGTMTGGVAGALIGSTIGNGNGKLVAVAAGTLAGAYLGGAIGKNMDETDKLKTQAAIETNRSNQPTTWKNPDTGAKYTVTPKKTYQTPTKQYCREYTLTATIAGKQQQTYGTACRQPDGTWKVQK